MFSVLLCLPTWLVSIYSVSLSNYIYLYWPRLGSWAQGIDT